MTLTLNPNPNPNPNPNSNPDPNQAPEYRGFSARKIYRKYISDNAPTMLGIEDRLRKAIAPINP